MTCSSWAWSSSTPFMSVTMSFICCADSFRKSLTSNWLASCCSLSSFWRATIRDVAFFVSPFMETRSCCDVSSCFSYWMLAFAALASAAFVSCCAASFNEIICCAERLDKSLRSASNLAALSLSDSLSSFCRLVILEFFSSTKKSSWPFSLFAFATDSGRPALSVRRLAMISFVMVSCFVALL